MVSRLLATLVALCLCASPALAIEDWQIVDYAGYRYPPECQRDLLADKDLQSRILFIYADLDPLLGGVTHPELVGGRAFVLLNKRHMGSWKDRENRAHETCHVLFILQGRDPHWHP